MPEKPTAFDLAALLRSARSRSASLRQEFERAFGPGLRALFRHYLGGADLDRRVEETLAAIVADLQDEAIRPEDLLRYVRQRVKDQVATYRSQERAPLLRELPPERIAAVAKSILATCSDRERAIVDRIYRLMQTDDEIARDLDVEGSEIQRVRKRIRAEFNRLAAQPPE